MSKTINTGWLTDFEDVYFAPKTLFTKVLHDNSGTDLLTYLTTLENNTNNHKLVIDLGEDGSKAFSTGVLGVQGILDVPNGGTGLNSIAKHHLLVGNDANDISLIAPLSSSDSKINTCVLANNNGATPSYKAITNSWYGGDIDDLNLQIKVGDNVACAAKIPNASTSTAGVVTKSNQTFGGKKTFYDSIDVNNKEITSVAGMQYTDNTFYFMDNNENVVAYVNADGIHAINFISEDYNFNTDFKTIYDTSLQVNLASDEAIDIESASGGMKIGVTGTLDVPNGGTGTSTAPTAYGIIYAASTSAYASTGAGTAGQVLMSNGTKAPSWHTPTSTNTANAIVQRDSSGNFSAGAITLAGRTPAIKFTSTDGLSYLQAPADQGVAFCVADTVALASSALVISSAAAYPGKTNLFTLGTSSYKWANVYATTFTGALDGNASTASAFSSARTIKLTGDVTGEVSSTGASGWEIETVVGNNSHTHTWSNISDRTTCTINTSGTITGSKVYGAVWNDYAEYRTQLEIIKPGYCVVSNNSGQVSKTTRRYQACDGIVSDTFGFAIGETDKCKTPLAVAGRVLAYCEGDRYNYQAGDTVCAGPDGKVCKMTREEVQLWPDRIVGTVSEIPEYDTWGTGNVKVNGRIWIKIK